MKVLSRKVEELLSHLSRLKPRSFSVVVMPDFFLDRFVSWNGDVKQFSRSIFEVVNRKGGSIDNVAHVEFRGGNAVNTAAALAVLGVNVFPIVYTSTLGLNLLKLHLQPLNVDLSHVKIDGNASITTALEFTHGGEKRNVMLRDLGSLEIFGPDNLTEKDFALLEKTDYVCVFNWAGTRRHGTELAKTVFHHAKTKGKGKTYYDTADPLPNKPEIPSMVKEVLLRCNLIDVLSLNENEA
ncbi:MAG: carbohydrate kinase family protein, partial [Candidatus Bathyarchaeota archaeon]|nr:carbohydrate kinase family protein [Candidatus Bathyarchaeota archaeon]